MGLFGALAVMSYGLPYFMAALPPLGGIYFYVQVGKL
jgi:hypothetical protein